MSGPIVRKYGFPNFENIFGKRELEHGVDETTAESTPAQQPTAEAPPAKENAKPSKTKKKN